MKKIFNKVKSFFSYQKKETRKCPSAQTVIDVAKY